MKTSGPFWVKRMSRDGSPVDHLSLQEPGLRMANQLLPGITNTTNRVRNYTVAAWLTTAATDTRNRRILETAYIHAVHNHAHLDGRVANGVVGINSGKEQLEAAKVFPEGHPNVSVLGAPFYGPSSRRLGAVGHSSTGHYGPTDDPIGQRLARCFQVSNDVMQSLLDGTLTPQSLDLLSSLCLCSPPHGEERDLLLDLIFRFTRRTNINFEIHWDRPRRLSLALILQHLDEGMADASSILTNLISWVRGRSSSPTPNSHLIEQARGFAVLGLRSMFKLSLETVWCSMMRDAWMHSGGLIDTGRFAERMHEKAQNEDLLVASPESSVRVQLELSENLDFPVAGIQTKIADALKNDKDPALAAAFALDTLIKVAAIVNRLPQDLEPVGKFISEGDPDRASLLRFIGESKKCENISEWVNLVFGKYTIRQHLKTAAAKWIPGGADGFFMNPVGQGWEVKPEGEHIFPSGTPTKISTALGLIQDLGLFEISVDKVKLTTNGKETLDRVLSTEKSMRLG